MQAQASPLLQSPQLSFSLTGVADLNSGTTQCQRWLGLTCKAGSSFGVAQVGFDGADQERVVWLSDPSKDFLNGCQLLGITCSVTK